MPMNVSDFMTVISFAITFFGIGYTLGKDKTRK